jgi:hypothetical protein
MVGLNVISGHGNDPFAGPGSGTGCGRA